MEEADLPPTRPGAGMQVALFVTCLANSFRPSVADATVRLLAQAGCDVHIPEAQSCCGQPGYNSGDRRGAASTARMVIRVFERYQYVVVPSGSCAGMLRIHYPKLLEGEWRARAENLAGRVYELTQFLDEVLRFSPPPIQQPETFAYHDSCAGFRELGIHAQPRRLLAQAGHTVRDIEGSEVCCGFGGTFCARMPAISARMSDDKLRAAERSEAPTLLAGDLGCLLSLAGRARRRELPLRFRHVAEVLAGDLAEPAIGEAAD